MKSAIVLVTGFNAFGASARNPTEVIVERMVRLRRGEGVVGEVLPTEFARAGERIRELVAMHRPAVCLSFGLNQRASAIMLERKAVNCSAGEVPDNAGQKFRGAIVPEGPGSYAGTLPYSEISAELERRQIPFGFSDSAGMYVCNHVFYLAGHAVTELGLSTRFGFVHVPWPSDWEPLRSDDFGMSFDAVARGMESCVDACIDWYSETHLHSPKAD